MFAALIVTVRSGSIESVTGPSAGASFTAVTSSVTPTVGDRSGPPAPRLPRSLTNALSGTGAVAFSAVVNVTPPPARNALTAVVVPTRAIEPVPLPATTTPAP